MVREKTRGRHGGQFLRRVDALSAGVFQPDDICLQRMATSGRRKSPQRHQAIITTEARSMTKKLRQVYGDRRPKGYLLAHNTDLGGNGFRIFWIPPQWITHEWSECPCGWRPDLGPHYARADLVKGLKARH